MFIKIVINICVTIKRTPENNKSSFVWRNSKCFIETKRVLKGTWTDHAVKIQLPTKHPILSDFTNKNLFIFNKQVSKLVSYPVLEQ